MILLRPISILGLLWQIFRLHLVSDITVSKYPELIVLLGENEPYAALQGLTADQILARWMKYHVEKAGISVRSASFAADFKDPHLFCALLHQLEPLKCSLLDGEETAETEIVAAHAVKCGHDFGVDSFLSASDLVKGNPRLLMGFAAQIFGIKCGLDRELEYHAFTTYINQKLGNDAEVRRLLPLNPASNDLLFNVSDGLILSKLLLLLSEDLIDIDEVLGFSTVDSDDLDEVY